MPAPRLRPVVRRQVGTFLRRCTRSAGMIGDRTEQGLSDDPSEAKQGLLIMGGPRRDRVSGRADLVGILDEIGVGNFHWKLMGICGVGWTADNGWMQVNVLSLVSVQREFGVPEWQLGFMGSSLMLGMCVGSQIWGTLADRIGRKRAFTLTLVIAGVMGLVAAASVAYWMLIISLFCVGIGVGGNLPVDGAMFAEFMPTKDRGRYLTLLSVFWSFGGFIVALLGYAVIPEHSCAKGSACPYQDNLGWRLLMGIFSILCILSFVTRLALPETPAFLVHAGRISEARSVLRLIAADNGITQDSNPGLYEKIDLLGSDDEATAMSVPSSPTSYAQLGDDAKRSANAPSGACCGLWAYVEPLFQGRNMRRTTLLLWGIWFGTVFGFTSINLFLTKLLEKKNITSNHLYRDALLYSAAGIPGSAAGAYLVETRLGRKWTMFGATAITSIALFLFLLVRTETQAVTMSCVVNGCSMIMFAAYYTYTPEVYATHVRGRGVGVASGFSRAAGVTSPLLFAGFSAAGLGVDLPTLICVGFLALSACFMAMLPIRTVGRKLAD